jgi:hypothetical protein
VKVLVFIDADLVVRHFVMSAAFAELAAKHDVRFVFLDPEHVRMGPVNPDMLDLHGADHVILKPDPLRVRLWSELFTIDRLRLRPERQFRLVRRIYRDAQSWKGRLLYQTLALPGLRQLFTWFQLRRLDAHPNQAMEDIFDREKPDLVVHPTVLSGPFINDVVQICRRRGIPHVLIMNSWDNPSSKQAVVGHPDLLLVWGEQTEQHALYYMNLPPSRIRRFGAAQFEIYREAPRMDRVAFCASHDIDPGKQILLYAGSSKETDEFEHLLAIEGMIERGELPDTVLLYRPHPWGQGGHGGHRIIDQPWKHVRLEVSMRGYLEQVKAGNPAKALPDYRNTRDLLCHIDALVSPLSTIIVEAARLGRPVLCFLPEDELEEAEHLRIAMPCVHFDALYEMPGVLIARSRASMLQALPGLMTLASDAAATSALCKATDVIVEPFEESWGDRFVALAEELAKPPNATHRTKEA